MARKRKWLVACIFLIAAIISLTLFSGHLVKPLLELAIRSHGFPDAQIESVTVIPNGILLENVSLDGDSFSTIEAAQVKASLPDIIFKKKIENIEFKNIELTGEINEQGQYVIAGWNASLSSDVKTGGSDFLIENIAMNGLTLDFETPEGAIRIEGKLALQSSPDKTREFQANLWGKQKQLSLNATAIGKIMPDGQWTTDVELLEGRIDTDAFKATRAAGTVTFKSAMNGISYQGKMMAGGIRINDIPFQDFEIAFDATKPEIVNLKTSPTGHDGIVLSGRLFNKTPLTLEMNADIKDIEDLANLFELKKSDLVWLNKADPLKFSASAALSSLSLPQIPLLWAIDAGPDGKVFKGTAEYNRDKGIITGDMPDVQISAIELSRILPLKEQNDIMLTDGNLSLNGKFSVNLNQSPLIISGSLNSRAKNIGGTWQDYPFTGISGDVVLNQLYPWSIAKNQMVAIAAIGTGVNLTNGNITFDGSAKDGLMVKKAEFNMAEGKLSAAPFKWITGANENSLTVKLDNISLNSLATTVAAEGFTADGVLSGTLPLAFNKQGIVFKAGEISSTGAGSFKYAPSTFPAALQGDDVRMNTVREALSNFNFSSLEISINGDLDNNLKTTLKASGKNPVFSDRVINLNINLEGALVPALQQALQPGRIADRIEKSVTGEQ